MNTKCCRQKNTKTQQMDPNKIRPVIPGLFSFNSPDASQFNYDIQKILLDSVLGCKGSGRAFLQSPPDKHHLMAAFCVIK